MSAFLRPVAWLVEDRRRRWAAFLLLILAAYVIRYATHPSSPSVPGTGWWTWFDQGHYHRSALAFREEDLSAARHWYPPGYALLGAVGGLLSPTHPFILVDAALMLVAARLFVAIAEELGAPEPVAMVTYLVCAVAPRWMLDQWVIPWPTTPMTVIGYLLLLAALRPVRGGVLLLLGMAAAASFLFRPVEAVLVAPLLAAALLRAVRSGTAPPGRAVAACVAGGLLVTGTAVLLHLAIHGARLSPYLEGSRQIGFAPEQFPLRFQLLFLDPAFLYDEGTGILRAYPWLIPGLVGLLAAPAAGWGRLVVALYAGAAIFLYSTYNDLLPTGLWRYHQIHYFKAAIPLLGLLGVLCLRDLGARRHLVATLGAAFLVVAFLASEVRLVPRTRLAVEGQGGGEVRLVVPDGAFALDLRQVADADALLSVAHRTALALDGRPRQSWAAWRLIRVEGATRLVPLRGLSFSSAVLRLDGEAAISFFASPMTVLALERRPAVPCWLPGRRCAPTRSFAGPPG